MMQVVQVEAHPDNASGQTAGGLGSQAPHCSI
jgi:hypothetical protein